MVVVWYWFPSVVFGQAYSEKLSQQLFNRKTNYRQPCKFVNVETCGWAGSICHSKDDQEQVFFSSSLEHYHHQKSHPCWAPISSLSSCPKTNLDGSHAERSAPILPPIPGMESSTMGPCSLYWWGKDFQKLFFLELNQGKNHGRK